MTKEDNAIDAMIQGQVNSRGCTCMTGVLKPAKSSLKKIKCKDCGKIFKTNIDTEYCSKCRKKH